MASPATDRAPGRLAAVVLAAGAGIRLRPLTDHAPKALCPVGNVPLVDRALDRLAALASRPADPAWVAVNVWHRADEVAAHVAGRAHVSREPASGALGTAGALGLLRPWIAGRAVIVTNADAYLAGRVPDLLAGWDGERIRLLTIRDPARADFAGGLRYAGVALMPAADVAALPAEPAGLYEVSWRAGLAAGRVALVPAAITFVDCGTPSDYLRANLHASGGASVVGAGAAVGGVIERCVVWPGGVVAAGEHLVECIRVGSDLTVPAPLGQGGAP